jgi:methylglyoxal synthase
LINANYQPEGITTPHNAITIGPQKKIALVAHDNKKDELMDWARFNRASLSNHLLYATGTTGTVLERILHVDVQRFQSGPLGGDLQIASAIVAREIDCLIFFWDPLASQPHDPDVKALLRIAAVWNIPIASNRASADFIISSPLMQLNYERLLPSSYDAYIHRMDTDIHRMDTD